MPDKQWLSGLLDRDDLELMYREQAIGHVFGIPLGTQVLNFATDTGGTDAAPTATIHAIPSDLGSDNSTLQARAVAAVRVVTTGTSNVINAVCKARYFAASGTGSSDVATVTSQVSTAIGQVAMSAWTDINENGGIMQTIIQINWNGTRPTGEGYATVYLRTRY